MALIPKPHGEPMTFVTERPEASSPATETTLKAATATTDTAVRGGSYVTLPAGVPAGVEGSYVTVAGGRNLRSFTRGSFVTVGGTPVVAAGVIEGSYVTLPTAA